MLGNTRPIWRRALGALSLAATVLSPLAASHASAAPDVTAPAAPWVSTMRETGLWSGYDEQAREFGRVPPGTVVQALETRGRRTFVYYGGDRQGRRPGEVWVEAADLTPSSWPRWVRSRRVATIHSEPGTDTPGLFTLPGGAYLETAADSTSRWARVFYLGDGRTNGPIEGWAEAVDFGLPAATQDTLASLSLNRAILAQRQPEVWLRVPYQSQLDDSPYADANCGPTSVAMALEAFGLPERTSSLRSAALAEQGTPDCDECGVDIEHLASVARASGLSVYGLRGEDEDLRSWSLDDVRAQLRAGRVIIAEVRYRLLPGRATSPYWDDHYIVLSGILADRFIYNDSIDADGTGYGRLISAEGLQRAMAASNVPNAAFAAGRERDSTLRVQR
ncbi:MAG TPA: C39 family peptidase [Chloroflexota bacterium]|nr:C39 family peptidase [Chloroflexota bacterium]